MGLTIYYRGTIDNIARIEEMENRVLDLVFSLRGRATLWRSYSDTDRSRVVRGLMVEMEPGHETFSLLISPEGHLTPLFQIEEAETNPFDEIPLCWVKTQFGTPFGHAAIVQILEALKREYFSNLSITDEGEFYETRDFQGLAKKMGLLNSAIKGLTDGLREHSLSNEAAEDPSIVATRIERLATLVHRKITGESQDREQDSEQESKTFDHEWNEPTLEEEVQSFDELRRRSDLRSERMARRITEATANGLSPEQAFELAMQEQGFGKLDTEESDRIDEFDTSCIDSEVEETWRECQPNREAYEDLSERTREEHPAVVQARDFVLEVMKLTNDSNTDSSFLPNLARASLDIMGGLVQATSSNLNGRFDRALSISQLKRALHGHGFARGALFGLSSDGTISKAQFRSLQEQLETILQSIHTLAEQAWGVN